jgi:hypothetical protein
LDAADTKATELYRKELERFFGDLPGRLAQRQEAAMPQQEQPQEEKPQEQQEPQRRGLLRSLFRR